MGRRRPSTVKFTTQEMEFARLRYEERLNLAEIAKIMGKPDIRILTSRVAEKMQLQTLIDRESRKSGSTTTNQAHGYIGRQYIQPPE